MKSYEEDTGILGSDGPVEARGGESAPGLGGRRSPGGPGRAERGEARRWGSRRPGSLPDGRTGERVGRMTRAWDERAAHLGPFRERRRSDLILWEAWGERTGSSCLWTVFLKLQEGQISSRQDLSLMHLLCLLAEKAQMWFLRGAFLLNPQRLDSSAL